ncbi:GumC family protein [uncultured Methylobacterium sp.]|uniref:GumC family protein n=1 Tax=uncultured Methylobacterium sp. TaxID=157278 RepID=UPI00259296EE|nr:GumC family protein [uncultured Methylobacterium sp.]
MSQGYEMATAEPAAALPRRTGGTLADLWGSARRRALWIVAGACAMGLLGGLFALRQVPTYRATVELLIDPQALQIVGRGLSRQDAPAQLDFANLESQSLILLSTKLLDAVVAQLDLDHDPVLTRGAPPGADPAVVALEALRKRIVVRRVENSFNFQLTVGYPDARRAAEIANTIAAQFFEIGARDRVSAVRRANEGLLTQAADLRAQLNRADVAVERYRAEKGLIGSGDAGLLVSQQLKDLYTQITAAETNLARLSARREVVRQLRTPDGQGQAVPESDTSQVMVSLRTQYAQTLQEIAQLSRSLGPNHPQMIALSAQRAATARLIAAEADRIRRTIEEDLRRGEESLRQLRARAERLIQTQTSSNQEGIRLRQLESEAEAIRRTYNLVLDRTKDLEQQQSINPSNSQIVSRATVPLKPSDTPAPIVVVAAGLFGAVLGLILGFLYDLWRGNITTVAALGAAGAPVWARLSRPGRAGRGASAEEALVTAARELRTRLSGRAQAVVVTVVSEGLGPERLHAAEVLTDLLLRLGEPALLVPEQAHARLGFGDGPSGDAPVRGRLAVLDPARGVERMTRPEIIVAERDVGHGDGWLSIPETSDAILLVVAPGRMTRSRLERLLATLDGAGRFRAQGLLGLVAVEARRRPAARRRAPALPGLQPGQGQGRPGRVRAA